MVKKLRIIILLFFIALAFLSVLFSQRLAVNEKAVFQSKAQAGGIDAIQQQVNSAKDGATITIPAGTYSGATAIPLSGGSVDLSNARGTANTCFLRIEGKKLTLQGQGAVLFGEGHDKPYQDPYQNRAGVCIFNSRVTIDGLKIKEFQKRCMVVYDSTIVIKNSVVEGCDEGGVSMLGNSVGLFVNNYFVATGAVLMWQNSFAKLVNNTIFSSNIQFFLHPNSNDQARVEAINNIIVNGESTITQVGWWPNEVNGLKNSKLSYNLIWKEGKECNPPLEYCDDFPGKVIGDPLFIEPVIDQRGIAAWANFGFKEGSPAVGIGDPNIPGPKNLGVSGGPCVEPNSSICSNFVKANTPSPVTPTPIPASEEIPEELPEEPVENQPVSQQNNGEFYKVESEVGPQKNTGSMFVKQGTLFLQNSSPDKTFTIKGLALQGQFYVSVEKNLDSNTVLQYDYTGNCSGLANEVKGGLIFSSSSDQFSTMKYKQLTLNCFKAEVIDFE